jgi:hypothetical protein
LDFRTDHQTDHSRERQLWCAVIGRAVQDAIRPSGPGGLTTEQIRQRNEARRWFIDNDPDFRKACEAAGFDPDFLRERVLRLTEDDPVEDDTAVPGLPAAGRAAAMPMEIADRI